MFGEVGIDAAGQVGLPGFLKFGARQVPSVFLRRCELKPQVHSHLSTSFGTPLRMPMLPTCTSPK
ncbi:hypothetical protein SAMN05443248_7110 [Bradyrhizobium erythrophlei]|uniref:Uncharacterized protein n=1 Tax=Bradyrhizobium erythrophlei TaxID=1437360 RepID=A0A1M5X7V4_9BRAD|nr:hypothetical protein SAMN05443248_7110 [Bradyrhizobium erythrophlei]